LARQKLGQHFLIQRSALERIAAAACPIPEPLVVEIGPGKGALTEYLLTRAGRVVAVELDPEMIARLQSRLADEPRLTVIQANALEYDFGQLGPAVIAGNLPYYAATPIIERIVALRPLTRAVFLVQKEVAERVAAAPGHSAYGYLSVRTQLFADVECLFGVKATAFRPPPKVDSAVLRLTPGNRVAQLAIADVDDFLRFVARCFRHKRKTIRNNLAGLYPPEAIEGWPEAGARAEQLSLEQFAGMYRRLH
jgi:16S rRNA (adenine1518-N6/adenine1519-N6)-dimethyltransferase